MQILEAVRRAEFMSSKRIEQLRNYQVRLA